MSNKKLIAAALAVAKTGLPVFPTHDKKPAWSNAELGVKKGEGGYKIATTDPKRIKELFSHERATEIAVPMGEMSGLICIDVDHHKSLSAKQWMLDNMDFLKDTRSHRTRNGGRHYTFKHPGDQHRFPSTLSEGVDLKAGGTGYVCWPGTEGYEVMNDFEVQDFPLEVLEQAMRDRGGSGATTKGDSFNPATDDELVAAVQDASDLYPALRTLSFRLPSRRNGQGKPLEHEQMVHILKDIMDSSVASKSTHVRHEDWLDRSSKIDDLVESSLRKHNEPVMSDEFIELMKADGPSFFNGSMETDSRPTGPQRETTAEDIEKRVAEFEGLPDGFVETSVDDLHDEIIKPVEWLVPSYIPKGNTVGMAGASNVGKTRWLAGLAVSMSVGQTDLMGLPPMDREGAVVLWVANEERVGDIKRRMKAFVRLHKIKGGIKIVIRGKDHGTLKLATINQNGVLQVAEKNVASLIAAIRHTKAEMVIFDPYVTLNEGGSENAVDGVAVLRRAFLAITNATGAAILYAHHTPKRERNSQGDWYRGQETAFRGSGDIAAQLDCGFTLSQWWPPGSKSTPQRKAWMEHHIDDNLSRFIELCPCKIREGEWPERVVYELVGQEMDEGEGMDIGVCLLSSEAEASNCLVHEAADQIRKHEIAHALYETFGLGEVVGLTKIHKKMLGNSVWPEAKSPKYQGDLKQVVDSFAKPSPVDGGVFVQLENISGKWGLKIWEESDDGG
jgi:hypothetical protein